jgi:acyl-CoA reductase-like NAD-dependent aldehyde dehydrogenase
MLRRFKDAIEANETYKAQLTKLYNEKALTDDIDDNYDECCDMCDCYHGHHPWCQYSNEN